MTLYDPCDCCFPRGSPIQYKISDYQEEIERINIELNIKQILLSELLTVEEVSLEALLFYKDDLLAVKDIDSKIVE